MPIDPLQPVRGQTAFALRQHQLAPVAASEIDALPTVEAKRQALARALAGAPGVPGAAAPAMPRGQATPTVAEKEAFKAALPGRPLNQALNYAGLTAGVMQAMRDVFGGPRDFQGLGPARTHGVTGPNAYGGDVGRSAISGASRSVAGKVGGNGGKPGGNSGGGMKGSASGKSGHPGREGGPM